MRIKNKYGGIIPFDKRTYGDLIAEINVKGIKLYTSLRLQIQIKKEN